MKPVIVLDPAHGMDVVGKCSPDKVHREYIWSRERCYSLEKTLTDKGYLVYLTTKSINEPGLTKRKNFADQVAKGHKKLFLSLHNNAAGSDNKWHSASGASVYTTKGVTEADTFADIILKNFKIDFPEIKVREYKPVPLERDFEENFTVLTGYDYVGVLVEWLFQDNKNDVALLLDPDMNKRFESSIIKSIEEMSNLL